MAGRRIECKIDRNANVTIEAIGFSGQACAVATAAIEAKLGGNVQRSEKPEWYATTESQQNIEQQA